MIDVIKVTVIYFCFLIGIAVVNSTMGAAWGILGDIFCYSSMVVSSIVCWRLNKKNTKRQWWMVPLYVTLFQFTFYSFLCYLLFLMGGGELPNAHLIASAILFGGIMFFGISYVVVIIITFILYFKLVKPARGGK